MSRIQEFDFSVDLLKVLLWQYNDAENLQSLLQLKEDWYTTNQSEFWSNWYTDVFDLRTANSFGLSVWSIILGFPLYVITESDTTKPTFGFSSLNQNFDNGNFSSITGEVSAFSVETSRLALQLRYHQMTCSCTVPETNRMLARLFGDRGGAYILDGLNMTQTYVFKFKPTSQETDLLTNYDLLPRPAGVGSEVLIVTETPFGFSDNNVNYDNGTFRD